MKRLLAAALAIALLLLGCGGEAAETQPPAAVIEPLALEGFTDFGSFTADAPGDAEGVRIMVADALGRYPAGLLEQLGPVEILLGSNLTGEAGFSHGSYAGFTQRTGAGWRIVLDADACTAGTVHHEIAHILDAIVTDAGLLTEGDWLAFCPSGFAYGGSDWADYSDFFCDAYAMTNMQEDRARVFEEAMQLGPGAFGHAPALWLKLEYFSRAIRAHFDTAGWPEKTAWEQALD